MKLSDRKFRQIVSLIAAIAIFVSIFPIQNSAQAANPWDNYSQYLQQPSSTPNIRGMRATWLVTAYGSDWPSTKVTGPSDTAGIQAQKQELIAILDRAVELNLNAIMYQVRPASDAMYKSDLVPWSGYLSGGSCANAGVDPGYDPLEFAIEEAHKRGLELHAWCNPYRAATAISDIDVAKLKNVDKSIFNQHPEWVKKASDGVYVADPGNPGVQKWVKACVMEIVKKYDVDGIHFDDYFYHETVKNDYDDSATFTAYGAGFNNKEDWRRNNVTLLIESLSEEIRSEKPWVKFGISPAGVWGNIRDGHADGSNTNAGGPNYDKAFADTRKWANDGAIDYICPQVYWSNGLEVASYGEIATWWAKNITNPNTQLYVGMALYKANANSDPYWIEGEGAPEIDKQLKLNANYPNIDGSFLYQSSNLSATTQASAVNSVRANWPNKAIIPAYTWKNSVPPAMPTTNEPTATSEGAIDLTWSDNDTNNATMYYCLYRFGKDENVNTNDATKLIATVGKSVTSYHETVSDPSQVKYVVTALDRLHNQSFLNAPIPVTGSAISIDVSTAIAKKPLLPPSVSVPMSDGSTANMMVKWNAVQDSSVTSNGSFQVNGQVLNSNLTVTANVTVKDKAVKYAYPVKTTTARGTKPTMPTQVNVVYTDDSVAVCSVTWNPIDSASYANVGVFNLNGTVDGSSLTVRADVIVIPDITSITEVNVSTMATVNPMLPSEVEVTYSDSKTAKLPVLWDKINASSYASEGSFKVNGTVDGTATKAVANVTVTKYVEAVSIDSINITSGIAVVPNMPSTVNVHYNDGSTAQRPVVWNTIDAAKLAFTNRFKVSGTVDGIKLSATAIVKVASKIVIDDYEDVGDGSSKVAWNGASITSPVPTPPTVSYNTVKDYIKSGERSLKVDYNFVGSSGTASAYVTPVNEIKFTAAAQPKKIGMWVYGDGSNLYQLRISINASSSTFAKVVNSGKLDYTGWKYLEFDMPTDLIGKDTYLTFAPGLISTSQRISSTIYIDDLVAIYGTDTIDYTEVNAAISAAQDIYDTATVGTVHGNYTANAKAALQKAITSATSVKNNTAATLEEIYTATDLLNTTIEAFITTQIVSQKEVVLDDFEKYKSSSSDNTEGKIDNKWFRDSVSTATGTIGIATDSTYVKSGSQSLMIQYNMGDSPTATSALKLRFNDNNGFIFDKGKCPDKLGFWFYGDSSGNRSRIQLNTVAGLSGGSLANSTYNAYDSMSQFTPMSWSGWHYVELPVASLKPVFSDANNYVAVTIPYWIQYLSGAAKTGTLYIDDYIAIYNVTSQTPIDKTGLNAAILTAQADIIGVTEGIAGGLYPVGSTLTLKNAIAAAKLVLNSNVQADITQVQTMLETAIKTFLDGQIPLLDKVGLKSLIDSAQSKYAAAVEGSQPNQHVAGSKATLLIAINAANDVYVKADATKLEIDTAKVNITAAIEKFDLSIVPKINVTVLNQKISEAEALYDTTVEGTLAGQYKAGAKVALLAEINTAKGAITNAAATQEFVDTAVANLTAAIQAFENNMIPLNVDKDLLENTISATQSRIAETTVGTLGGQYPQTARTAMTDAIETAQKISENIHASQDEVNAAIPVLNGALTIYLNTRIAAPWDAYSEYIPKEVSAQKRELRAVWVSTVINIDWPSKDSLTITDIEKRVAKQKAELVNILDGVVDINGNAVMFQVRPTSDAFYKSDLAPWSYFLTGSLNGDPGFDPLAFAVEEAHKRNLELHTWFNPYRVSMPATFYGKANLDEVRQMLANEPKSIYSKHPEWAKVAQNRLVLDPGIPGARKYVEDCIMEVVNNYDVDGVHFDDYFYVGTTGGSDGITDTDTYQQYGNGFSNIEDWRRNNTYLLIKELSNKIKDSKSWVKFGISPAGVWANQKDGYADGSATKAGIPNYSHAYADTKKWVLEELIDYICPQIYWTFDNSAAGFGIIADWWADLLDANPNIHTQLYIGEGAYWLDPLEEASDKYWLNGEGANELERQFKYNITRPSIKGTVIFTYSTLQLPQAEAFIGKLKTSLWNTKALVPEMPYKGGVVPPTPSLQSAISGANGAELKWTDNDDKSAYFAIYRFDKNEDVNINDAKHLIDTVRKTANGQQNYVDTDNKTGSGKYVVTALNRLHDESLQSNKVDVSGLPVIDKAGLLSLIDNAHAKYDAAVEGVKPGQYVVGSKAELLIVINAAKVVSVKVDVTKEEIDTAKLNLTAAIEKFNANAVPVPVPAINLTILNQKISAAQALLDAAEEGSLVGQYKVGAKAALLAGINRAKGVIANINATQTTIDAAVITLTADIQTFTSTKIISSGGSGSTQGSSGTAPSTNITVNSDGTTTLKTETTRVDKTSVTAKISKEDITKAFEQAKVDKAGNKKIIVEATVNDKSIDQQGYQIPVQMLTKTDGKNIIELRLSNADILLPTNMLTGVNTGNSDYVEMVIKKADKSKLDDTVKNEIGNHPVYELNLKIDNMIVNWNSMATSISVSVDYEATAEELKNPEFIVVWYIDNNGNIKPVPNGHYDAATKKVYFTTSHLSTYAIAYVNKNFSDLDRFKWAEKAIGVLAAKGITSGTGENKYSPEKNITRADFITLLVNTLELKAKYTDCFSDVKEGSYYAQSVNIAKALGITSGTGNNEVSPNTPISRQEMMVLIEKALKISNRELLSASTDDLARYTDVKDIQNYALNSIAVLVRNGIIEGSNNMINPKVNTNRAEAAVILYKLLDK